MLNLKQRKFRQAMERLFNTEDGLYVLATLKRDYVDSSCFDSDPLVMAYRNAQKDTIQSMLNIIEEEKLNSVNELVAKEELINE